jgi:flagellar M-ring protein FliF
MKRIFDHFYELIGRMTPSQVVLAALVVVGVIAGTVVIFNLARSQYFVPLYSNLSSEDAGKIIEKLREMKVQYEIVDGGASISVPSDDVYETRMKLASNGLPSPQNIGYALFDETNLGMTDFVQKLNYRRALEGELARTIGSLTEVSAARVHMTIPEDKLFKEDQNAPSASVVLKLNGGTTLAKRQLQGIAYIVASSVEGMKPEDVTIIDYDGNLLTAPQSNDPSAMMSATQFEMRKNVESYLEQKAQSMLSGVIGGGRAVVRVSAELNFEQNNTQIEEYNPDLVAVRSEQRTASKGNEQESVPGAPPVTTSSNSNDANDIITNYEVSKTIKSIIGEVGSIKRLTVAVMVDGNYEDVESPEGEAQKKFINRTPEELDRFGSIIKNAVGYSEARSDLFTIVDLPFDNSILEVSRKQLDSTGQWETYLYYGKKVGLVLLAGLAFFYVKRKLKKIFVAIAKYVPPPPPAAPLPEETIQQKPQKPKLIDTMKVQTKGKPDEIAKVIRTIMAEPQ